MNFDLSEEQRLVVDTVAAYLKKHLPVARLRTMRTDDLGWSRDTWRMMGESGWLGAMFPETLGGAGGGFLDAALILEQLGTTLVTEPYLPLVVAGTALVRGGTTAQQQQWLAPAIAGKTSLALAWSEAQSRFDPLAVATRVEQGRLTGEKRWVPNGHAADHLVVSAREGSGVSLYVVDRAAPGVRVTPRKTMDGHHAAEVAFAGVAVADAQRLGAAGGARAALEAAVDAGAAGACAEGYGIMRTALWMTVEYLRTREQFGVKIGTFQALQHRAVDMFVETELCRSMMILAALKQDDPDEVERKTAVSAAKAQLGVGGKLVAQQAIQLHGGIGVTDEHDIGLYFKRMQVLNTLFGDEEHHVARFAALPSFTAGVQAS